MQSKCFNYSSKSIVNLEYLFIISILTMLLGYEITDLFIDNNFLENLNALHRDYINNPGIRFFFRHNLIYFLIISIIPIINLPIFIIQMLVSGTHAKLIVNLPVTSQIELYYRHFLFEWFALMISVYISGVIYKSLTNLHKNKKYDFKNDLKFIVILYIVVIIFTAIAALLEGGAFA